MIISRTPFRISFFGGGTDYPVWYRENGGAILGTTINKYCWITCRYLPPFFEHKSRIIYSRMEHVKDIEEIQHPSVRACLHFIDIENGVEIHHDGDLPARAGLGSSSSFTVGLLNALYALKGNMSTKNQLALNAIHIEQDILKENVGSQDQTLAAYGGFNYVEFGGPEIIRVQPVTINPERLKLFEDCLMLFFTGLARDASEIAGEQIKETPNKKQELTAMYQIVKEGLKILNSNTVLSEFGKLLHESWLIKRSLTGRITNATIDEIYEAAVKAGALGGKLLGAGGGGFMLIFARPEIHEKIKEKLNKILYVPVKLENSGSQIIFYSP